MCDKVAGYIGSQAVMGEVDMMNVAVLPEYRHLGFGKQLVEHCRRKAKEYGGKKLRLLMIYQNAHLRALYESYGFTLKEIGHDAQHPFEYGIYEMEL